MIEFHNELDHNYLLQEFIDVIVGSDEPQAVKNQPETQIPGNHGNKSLKGSWGPQPAPRARRNSNRNPSYRSTTRATYRDPSEAAVTSEFVLCRDAKLVDLERKGKMGEARKSAIVSDERKKYGKWSSSSLP